MNARIANRLKATKINLSQWRVISVLRSYGTLSMSEIVDHSLMEQPTVSRIVTQLCDDGIVTRTTSEVDSRVMEITLTQTGDDLFAAIYPAALRHQDIALSGISKKDLSFLAEILAKIERNIEP